MSRGRRAASLEDLQRQYVAKTGDRAVAALLGVAPDVVDAPPAVLNPPAPRGAPGWAYRMDSDRYYRTTVEDVRVEVARQIAFERPEWDEWVWCVYRGETDEVPGKVLPMLVALWQRRVAEAIAGIPKIPGRKPQTKRMPPRKVGESSPCVSRKADGTYWCGGQQIPPEVAAELLDAVDPYAPDPEWMGRD